MPAPTGDDAIRADQVAHHVRILASDAMEGRGIGTKGIDASAQYVSEEMARSGLAPGGADGTWYQPFEMTVGVSLGNVNTLSSGKTAFALDTDWRPLEFSDSGSVEAPVVFAGYGITAPELDWDDYASLDPTGKIVLVLRHEPGEKDPKSVFNGTDLSRYAELRVKAINARVHGAAGLILVNDVAAHPEPDELVKIEKDMGASFAGLPAAHVLRRAADSFLAAAKTDVAALEKSLADAGKPASRELPGVTVSIKTDLVKTRKPVKNVVGVLAGSDPALKAEAIVIGAHYDHLGMGGRDSLDPNKVGQPHNGADDNASGTAALLAIARRFGKSPPPKRSLVFIAFTAEEAGLGGSSWWVNHPLWPLEKTAAMLNMDMVGRMRDKKVVAFGADTAKEFAGLLEAANSEKLAITARGDGYGPSDQTAFYGKGIPVLHFFTGAHADYHRTTDDADTIENEGLAQVARLVARVGEALANRDGRVSFVPSTGTPHAQGQTGSTGGYGAYFGSVPDFTESEAPGVVITGTRAGSPAEKAGLSAGDRLVKFGDVTIGNLYDLTFALRKYKPGDEVEVGYVRGAETKTVKAKLGKRE